MKSNSILLSTMFERERSLISLRTDSPIINDSSAVKAVWNALPEQYDSVRVREQLYAKYQAERAELPTNAYTTFDFSTIPAASSYVSVPLTEQIREAFTTFVSSLRSLAFGNIGMPA